MSVRAITWALDANVGDAAAKLLLVALADHADDQTQQCWPSIGYVARRCQLSEKTVQRRLRQLERKGLIETQARVGQSSIITLLMGTPVSVTGVTPVKQTPRSNRPLPRSDSDRTPRSLLTDRTVNEPSRTLDDVNVDARARDLQKTPKNSKDLQPSDSLISKEARDLADAVARMCGYELQFLPPAWCGAALQVQSWFNHGWDADVIKAGVGKGIAKAKSPPRSIKYFEVCIADIVASLATPVPVVKPGELQVINGGSPNGTTGNSSGARCGETWSEAAIRYARQAGEEGARRSAAGVRPGDGQAGAPDCLEG